MIFVICGTQKFQFDRLIKALDDQVSKGLIPSEVFAQIGGGDYKPSCFPFVQFMDDSLFKEKISEASLIITHSGTGSIINSVKAGKKVIVVPRLEKYGEHVSDHQVQIADMFEKAGLVKVCLDTDELYKIVSSMDSFAPKEYHSNTEHVLHVLDRDLQALVR